MARTSGSRASETGPRIRAAALRLFARQGYAAVSMRQIAAEVGLQVGALYNHTPDKQSLLCDLMETHMTDLLAACAAQDWPQDPARALEGFVRFHIRFHAARPDAVFMAYMELRNLAPENFERIEALRNAYENRLEVILSQGVACGQFGLSDVRIGTRAVIAMLTGLTTWFRPEGGKTLDEIEEVYVTLVAQAVRV
ncbi:TetR/AcrR family transcriptional regulator [Pseudooceanicola sp.]|uniref:TetR/AcrR family transcriptional regulator n=1 Tax=Pseudooceanicola sp. TaxID=1914328 RepID=UPI00262A1655|nr:TetR/AcrR family transcriptional regulator [Pseudooceanicola sp.]MDF1854858.1 TetR/AcrR family transcriptional regulator [Pseudooceanicola sp.]